MVVGEAAINNIMSGLENTGNVKQHNHRKKLKQRFDLIKKLGQGTFGKVQLGINKETGQEVAIKTIKKSKIESEADLIRIRREIQIMSSVQHPNIIHIYEVFENREKMVLVMEYAAGGELYDYLSERKVLTEEEARRIFRQIATACYYCHKHKICHRDLKLENILLDENNNAKIADFGLSNVFDDTRLLNTFCGSPLYASPEIVEGTPYQGPEVDCWSLGVLLYTLVYGAMPFDGSNFKRLVRQISQGDYYEPSNPSRASPLIREMLTVNPRKRANIEKICSHWWVNENYDENCFDISEELANRTPVRLDLLLSLAPPPQLDNDKLVVTGEVTDEVAKSEANAPARSQSVGSLMELTNPSSKRINELFAEEKGSPKRKLESTVSTDRVKDKIVKENTVTDIPAAVPLDKSLTQTISKEMDTEDDVSMTGAACSEIMEEANKSLLKRNLTVTLTPKLENITETSQENIASVNKENENKEAEKTTKKVVKKKVLADKNDNQKAVEPEAKPMERRRSRIFEAAEKFQNMMAPADGKAATAEKPKKIIIPGVSVDGFKKEFERKASLTSQSKPKIEQPKKTPSPESEPPAPKPVETVPEKPVETVKENERNEKVRNAVNIISSALDKEGTRKSKSRPMMRKPPVPFGASGRSASGNIGLISSALIQPLGPKPFVRPQYENKIDTAENKSATLPRPKKPEAEMSTYKTEATHPIAPRPKLSTQRSEVVVPVGGKVSVSFRSSSLEPESAKPRERIIPIALEESPKEKPTIRSRSLSRQSTQESDTDTVTSTGEPIKKSQREYIIPIAIEGGGYVTPRATSLEPVESTSSIRRFPKPKRFSSRLSDKDSEDESIFSNLHRHSSFGRDSDTEDSRPFHMHRLRSTRPKLKMEHADSVSSGEDDDEDGFDILTAENLFSTLLSRVRDLTQRLNVEDGGRPGFPSSRFMSHFDHGTNFWNNRPDPFTRFSSLSRTFGKEGSFGKAPWRKGPRAPEQDKDASLPPEEDSRNLNLSDIDLKKLELSEEDALALSYLTPGLTRRLKKQLLAELAPSEVRKLHRTLSSRNSSDNPYDARDKFNRRSVDRIPDKISTVPKRSGLPVKRYSRTNFSPESSVSESVSSHLDSELSSKIYTDSISSSSKRVSRFLRPDFYDTPNDSSFYLKDKREREMETQKVLKQIRDKRKERLREKSREKAVVNEIINESNIPEYVNVPKTSKIARPKSYPAETKPVPPKKESKLEKLRKGFSPSRKEKETKNEINKSINEEDKVHKNKLLHSIEKKLERFRSSPTIKDSAVENTIRKLREQSLPKNLEPCTESGLIKRAVSVEDLKLIDEKPLQASRKSVTKILGLFKKYEEGDKSEKVVKKKKVKNKIVDSNKLEAEPKETILTNNDKPTPLTEPSSASLLETKETRRRTSKLPVNSFRRSLNLEPQKIETEKKDPEKDERRNLRLDFSRLPRYSDEWSARSESLSPNGEEESVIDRIRRKSFYTRFNEKKRPSYPKGHGSLDRRYDYASKCSTLNDYVNVPHLRYRTSSEFNGERASQSKL